MLNADLARLADDIAETQCNQPQQGVAGGMAERVVDGLKAVEVKQKHRATVLAADGADKRVVECPPKCLAVGEASECILTGETV